MHISEPGVSMSDSEENTESENESEASLDQKGMKRTANDSEVTLSKPSKVAKTSLFKPPTNEELNSLKEAENLFQSNLFRLQINELLTEITVKEKWQRETKEYVEKLIHKLKSMDSGEEHKLNDQSWTRNLKVKVPILQEPVKTKGNFKFVPPQDIHIVGSFPLTTSIKPNIHIDLAVVIPKVCFHTKDYLNQRYFRKRALYLACMAARLNKWKEQSCLQFLYHNNNHMKPVLEVTPHGKLGSHVKIRIHIVPEIGSFKLNRFHICKNNVRRQWFLQDSEEYNGDEIIEEEDEVIATPHYNTTVLEDLTIKDNFDCMVHHIHGAQGIVKGVSLLKIWLHQRQLDMGHGFSGFIMTMFVVYLLENGKLNKMMNSYQLFRNTMIYLSKTKWDEEGISLHSETDSQVPSLQEFHDNFPVVFVDPSGYTNLCANMSTATFSKLKHEAKLAVEVLCANRTDSFDMLFMKPVPFMRTYDQVIHLSNLKNLKEACVKLGREDKLLDYSGDYVQCCVEGLIELLNEAIGKRVNLTDIRLTEPEKWSIKDSPPRVESQEKLSFGLLVNTDTYTSIIDKGPPADTLEANKFRSFWGEKSELRRFQDGSICEAVVWPSKTLSDKRKILGKCIKHVFNRHCDIPRNTVTIINSQLDNLLNLPKKKKIIYGTGEEQSLDVLRTFDELCKNIRTLRDLPLSINSIQGTAPVFRYAETFPPIKATFQAKVEVKGNCSYPSAGEKSPPYTPAISVLCLLEGSGKWPEDLAAVRRIKAAYHLKLSSLLEGVHSLVTNPAPSFVDVLKNGHVFRLQVGCLREIGVAKLTKTSDGLLKSSDNEESLRLERNFVAVPKLTSTLHGIQQQHGSFSGTVCLSKRWISSHMLLGDHIADEAVELIVAYIFISPAPYKPPGSPLVGFSRFLSLLSNWDWKLQPLLVNLNNQFTSEDYTEIHNKFNKERPTLPLMFISTPDDKSSLQWTRKQPTALVLSRLVLLARESLDVLQSQLEATHLQTDFKQIFRPPLEAFDVLIHLKLEQVSRQHQAVDLTKEGTVPEYTDDYNVQKLNGTMPVVDYDPVQCFLKELRAMYEDLALFFCDKYGGSVIGVLWKPQGFKQKMFKVSHLNAHMVKSTDKEVELVPNVEAIIQDFRVIGDGLVKDIESRSEKWTI